MYRYCLSYTILGFLCLFLVKAEAQDKDSALSYESKIFSQQIKTMRTYVKGNELSYAAIELNSEQQIHFEFDLMDSRTKYFQYQIIHCDADWHQSDLFSDEFMDGFNENRINDYAYSLNTTVKFIHYSLDIPNDDVQPKVSGNYIIRVIEDGNRDSTVAQARFCIYEPLVNVQADIVRPIGAEYSANSQEIHLKVFHDDLQIVDPFSEIKVVVRQNNRSDREIKNLKPVFVRNNELVYTMAGENIVLGGNEFRMFSSKSLHQLGDNVNDLRFVDTMYHVQLRLDERRSYKRYFWQEDINGRYVVYADNSYDYGISADYAYVYFYLPFENPYLDGKVYVFGEFNNWQTNALNLMSYNYETKLYELVMLMKQGIYNYSYIYKNSFTDIIDEKAIEGSHYETENDYLFFIYFNGIEENYDRLVGYQVVNSVIKN